jgi:hypothetical protein
MPEPAACRATASPGDRFGFDSMGALSPLSRTPPRAIVDEACETGEGAERLRGRKVERPDGDP